MSNIDKRYITEDFLLDHFPSPDRFQELASNPKESTLAVSEERYIMFRNNLNQERARSGKPPLSDSDLAEIIKHEKGYLEIKEGLKPNQHL